MNILKKELQRQEKEHTLKEVPNWKSCGHEGIYGFWL